jgi:hypothetical protein
VQTVPLPADVMRHLLRPPVSRRRGLLERVATVLARQCRACPILSSAAVAGRLQRLANWARCNSTEVVGDFLVTYIGNHCSWIVHSILQENLQNLPVNSHQLINC